MSRARWMLGLVLVGCATGRTGTEPPREPDPEPPVATADPDASGPAIEGATGVATGAAATNASPTSGDASPKVAPPMTVEAITGIPDCDAYLDLYARCEDFLRPQIMNGDRRFYSAEKGWLVHMADSPEAPTLSDACAGMLDQLRSDCPEQERAAPPSP